MNTQVHLVDDDASLVRRTLQGEVQAFEALVRRYYSAAHAVALGVLGTRMDAEDAVQVALVRALEQLGSCREPDRVREWLMQIVRNQARNARRATQRRGTDETDVDTLVSETSPAQDAERGELGEHLTAVIATLPPAQREVVLLHDLEGWSHADIARHVGCSEVMSRQHLFVARRSLRLRLAARGVGPADAPSVPRKLHGH
jgi:RNA polymerase sigma-70 factor (ECF subfamily)